MKRRLYFMLKNVALDIRYALAGWRRSPAFAISAIVTLALGIGANAAIFSVVNGVLLKPLPYGEPERLVQITETQLPDQKQSGWDGPVTFGDYDQWRRHSRLLEGLTTYNASNRNLQTPNGPVQVSIVTSEPNLFAVLGVSAMLGRSFAAGDSMQVAVVSYRLWEARFGKQEFRAGETVTLNGETFGVIGVMPASFQFPLGSSETDIWLPRDYSGEIARFPNRRMNSALGRMKAGASLQAVQQEAAGMQGPRLARRQVHVTELRSVWNKSLRPSLLVLLGAVGMVLLIACVNVANLMLARVASREREIAIRTSLGASRLRLMQQFLSESLLLAIAGGAAGLLLGIWGSRLLATFAAEQIPKGYEIGFDWRVFSFLLGACLLTGIGFGMAPAMAAMRVSAKGLKGSRMASQFREVLVVLQIGLAFVLMTGAGLLLRTFLNLQAAPTGLAAENVLTAHVVVTGAKESLAITERVGAIPGVSAVGSVSQLPLQTSGWSASFSIEGRPGLLPAELRYVTPGYFRALGIPLKRGRELGSQDVEGAPRVILVNETFARRYFPNEDAVGRVTSRGAIVGVVGDVHQKDLSSAPDADIYYSVAQNFAQMPQYGSTLVVRARGPLDALVPQLRDAVREVSPQQALFKIATMREVIETSLAKPRLYSWLLGLFAGMAVVLAAVGVYGVMAQSVAGRMREYGIRIALGSELSRVVGLVLGRGAVLAGLGLLLGLAGALAIHRILSDALYGVKATDAVTYVTMAAIMAIVAVIACLLPARRAAMVDPAVTLRVE